MFSSNTSQVSTAANYIEDVFSTWLYTGNSTSGGTQTITNGIDLSTKGGLVWIKGRSTNPSHIFTDTARGVGTSATNNNALSSNVDSGEDIGGSAYDFLSAFNTDGFTVTQGGTTTGTRATNYNAVTYTSWTFRKQPKFFDVVTYTGNGSNRTIAHNLGSVPGCIIVKRRDTNGAWQVYHTTLGRFSYLVLNSTAPSAFGATRWNETDPTSTVFSLGTDATVNANGGTYVAYLFANDAGGFGLTGADNVISCGSFTTDEVGQATVNLGYEPQWVLIKQFTGSDSWYLNDNMRGMAVQGNQPNLSPNSSAAESAGGYNTYPNATGFTASVGIASAAYIYIAIRRGPMRTPTTGTSVFQADAYSGTGASGRSLTTLSAIYLSIIKWRTGNPFGDGWSWSDRLRGIRQLASNSTASETNHPDHLSAFGPNQNTVTLGNGGTVNGSGMTYVNYAFQRAPGFFDEVCYTGTGSGMTISHNLGATPQIVILKCRDAASSWFFWSNGLTSTNYKMRVNLNEGQSDEGTSWISVSSSSVTLANGYFTTNNNVMYLFATVAGVSSVSTIAGTGSTQTVNCGFTGGARFVLIKRTDSTGDWYVWDSARGIVSGNDPYLRLNSTAAEVTNTNWINTTSNGFELTDLPGNLVNINGASYIFLAIA